MFVIIQKYANGSHFYPSMQKYAKKNVIIESTHNKTSAFRIKLILGEL